MKTLHFEPTLCELILKGEKTVTWRLFDDKDLSVGDEIVFANAKTRHSFGTGNIVDIKITTFDTLVASDWKGHETYTSKEEMYSTYRGYYGNQVQYDTEIKIVRFAFFEHKDE